MSPSKIDGAGQGAVRQDQPAVQGETIRTRSEAAPAPSSDVTESQNEQTELPEADPVSLDELDALREEAAALRAEIATQRAEAAELRAEGSEVLAECAEMLAERAELDAARVELQVEEAELQTREAQLLGMGTGARAARSRTYSSSGGSRQGLRYRADRVAFHIRQPAGGQHLVLICYRLTTRAAKRTWTRATSPFRRRLTKRVDQTRNTLFTRGFSVASRLPVSAFGLLGIAAAKLPRSTNGRRVAAQRVREIVHLDMSKGLNDQARVLLQRTADSHSHAMIDVSHALALSFGWDDIAMRVEATARAAGGELAPLAVILSAERMVANGMPEEAISKLDEVADPTSQRWVRARRHAAWEAGRAREALYLARRGTELGQVDAHLVEFDALWALGDIDAAESALLEYLSKRTLDPPTIPRALLLRSRHADAAALYEWVRASGATDPDDRKTGPATASAAVELAFQLGLREHADRLLEGARSVTPTHSDLRFQSARAKYVDRQFEDALRLLEYLASTRRSRDADKLAARIAFEMGDFEGAERARSNVVELGGASDEVLVYARLALGKFALAFEQYLGRRAFRHLAASYGGAAIGATAVAALDRSTKQGGSIFVVAQDGPGDEIIGASLFGDVGLHYDHVAATCDPRLESLLTRSFPEVEFVACQRQSSRPILGLYGPGREPRAKGGMHGELSEAAAAVAHSSDNVCFSRSLWALRDSARPVAPYLRVDATRAEAWKDVVPAGALGLVWRSEYSNPMRDIHFVRLEDLTPLTELQRPIVCLQHDATPAERARLRELFSVVVFVDDMVDLRDDFEGSAALVSALDVVVGPGTTVVELSAAVGTRTVCLQPNNFGKWRSINGGDFWHQSMSHACANDPRKPAECVSVAAALLQSPTH